jgi:pantoate kinase
VTPADTTSILILQKTPGEKTCTIANESPLLSSVLDKLGVSVSVVTECRLPISAGFGLSAAALISTLTATNRLCSLRLDTHEIALMAHEAEVTFRTGLGDVSACQGGGMVIRDGPGIDAAIVRWHHVTEPLCAVTFGPIHTPSVLGSPEQMAQVASAFPRMRPDGESAFFRFSREFAEHSGLMTPDVEKVLQRCDEIMIPASMTMLGNGVFAYGPHAREVLQSFGEVYEFRVAQNGVCILEGDRS